MMTTHASSRSSVSPTLAQWSVRSAIARSSPPARLGAVIVAVAALACTLDDRVPFTTGIVIVALLPAVLVDLIDRRLPNRLVGGAAVVGIVTWTVDVMLTDLGLTAVDPVLGAAAIAGPLLLTHVIRPAAMGFGDVKLAVVLGAALGLVAPVVALVALAIGSALTSVVGLVRSRRTIAFGPGLLGGAVLTVALVVSPFDPLGLSERAVAAGPVHHVTEPDDRTPNREGVRP